MFYVSLVLLITSLILYVYWRLKKTYSYFQRHGIPHIEPDNWIFGNMTDIFLQRKSFIVGFEEFYWKLEPHKFGGLYHMQKPMLIIRDPELLRNVMVKDFEYFQDRTNPQPNKVDLFSHNLFNLKGKNNIFPNLKVTLPKLNAVIYRRNVEKSTYQINQHIHFWQNENDVSIGERMWYKLVQCFDHLRR